jgi:membrane-bound ClpP family serine protease
MSIYLIAIFVIAGILLLLVEFLIIPGVSVAGIAGFILIALGIYFAYSDHDAQTGHVVLGSTIALSVVTAVFAFRSKTWKKMSLDTTVDSKVLTVEGENVHPGDEGICISRLNPMGKVQINGQFFEARSHGEFITEGSTVVVVKLSGNTLIVKPK